MKLKGIWLSRVPLPLKLGAVLGASIFLIEMAIMLAKFLPAAHLGAMADAGILTTIVSPILYLTLARPLSTQIAERDLAQTELVRAHAQLEFRVEERTRQLTESLGALEREAEERREAEEALQKSEEQLRQSQKMEAMGQLAGGIAHDFNNLLTTIIGYSDLMLAPDADALGSPRADVQEIRKAAERASALTRQILAFSRRQTLRPEVLSINAEVENMGRMLRRTLGEDIDLVTHLHPDLGLVKVDEAQLGQVLMNLALNARDAMPGGGRLTLETTNVDLGSEYCQVHPETAPGPFVMLAVSDTGVGMDEEAKSRAFEPFYTTKEPGKGTGLGLATVYGVVKQSGGNIFVYSEPGKGTTFKIYLPRVDGGERGRSRKRPAAGSLAGKETILVVEDEAAVCGLIERILRELGYRVLTSPSGDQALSRLREEDSSIDLLLTDMVLPGGLQGNELSDAARVRWPNLPVIHMSGYTRNAVVHSGGLDGGVNYLEKPFTPEGLARRVREVLDREMAAR